MFGRRGEKFSLTESDSRLWTYDFLNEFREYGTPLVSSESLWCRLEVALLSLELLLESSLRGLCHANGGKLPVDRVRRLVPHGRLRTLWLEPPVDRETPSGAMFVGEHCCRTPSIIMPKKGVACKSKQERQMYAHLLNQIQMERKDHKHTSTNCTTTTTVYFFSIRYIGAVAMVHVNTDRTIHET